VKLAVRLGHISLLVLRDFFQETIFVHLDRISHLDAKVAQLPNVAHLAQDYILVLKAVHQEAIFVHPGRNSHRVAEVVHRVK